MTYILRDGSKKDVEADIGDNVLELAHKHDIDLEGGDAIALYAGVVLQVPPTPCAVFICNKVRATSSGACECSIACSTCHVYVDEEYFDRIPEATEEEEDMLDLAFGLEETYHYLVLTGSVAMFVSHLLLVLSPALVARACVCVCAQQFTPWLPNRAHTRVGWLDCASSHMLAFMLLNFTVGAHPPNHPELNQSATHLHRSSCHKQLATFT